MKVQTARIVLGTQAALLVFLEAGNELSSDLFISLVPLKVNFLVLVVVSLRELALTRAAHMVLAVFGRLVVRETLQQQGLLAMGTFLFLHALIECFEFNSSFETILINDDLFYNTFIFRIILEVGFL